MSKLIHLDKSDKKSLVTKDLIMNSKFIGDDDRKESAIRKMVYNQAKQIYNKQDQNTLDRLGEQAYEGKYEREQCDRVEATIKIIKELNPNNVVDLGAGIGIFLKRMRDGGITNVLGLDASDICINIAKKRELKIISGDVHYPPFDDDSFDLVLCMEILEHVAYPDVVVWQCNRITRDRCIFSVPDQRDQPDYLHHLRIFNKETFRELISRWMDIESLIYVERIRNRDVNWPGWLICVAKKKPAIAYRDEETGQLTWKIY